MYRMLLSASLITMIFAAPALGQDGQSSTNGNAADNQGQLSMTPEIWQYLEQLKQYESPEARVQRNAAFRSAQRRMRIAARDWYGVSLSRPTASTLPHMGIYSPAWAGTWSEPSIWLGHGRYNAFRVTDYGLR